MAKVTHPTTGDVMTVPDGDEARWVESGWLPEERATVVSAPAPESVADPEPVEPDDDESDDAPRGWLPHL